MEANRVLLVDDDLHIHIMVGDWLRGKGYEVFFADCAATALTIARSAALDCIILDVDLPDGSGVEVCKKLRQISRVPILFLSSYDREDDRIQGLLAGGDDYIGKPFSLAELELRVRIRIDRARGQVRAEVLRFGALAIDLGLRQVSNGERTVDFSVFEFDLLAFMAQHPGQVFSYEQLYDWVWKEPLNKGLHNLQMCMAHVRTKLDELCPGESYIKTVRRKGYCFDWKQKE